ncbi:MAG: Amuc_1099 family pilus-like system protein [Verrucomicrobiales bacterium]|nr:hypothetical protein [Verrucomicrobiota bacterium JB025]
MSWLAQNYEKAALGGAVLVAAGVAFLGLSKNSGVDDDFAEALKGGGNNKTEVPSAGEIPKALQSLKLTRAWNAEVVGDRKVDLFTGLPLFVPRDNPENPIDLPMDPPVHPPIPNTWWLKYRLDPGFADSPHRDADGDGFSNIEEFEAKTDPSSSSSVPELLAKLMYVKDESLMWSLRPSHGSEGKFPFKYEDDKGAKNKVGFSDMVGPGDTFFAKEPMKDRFKFIGSEVRKEMDTRANYERKVTYVQIEDQRANKKGKIYEFPAPLSDLRRSDFLQYDRTAVLSLQALGMGSSEFKVEELTEFTLPPETGKKKYKLVEVTPQSVKVEYLKEDGSTNTVVIPKGGTPTLSE